MHTLVLAGGLLGIHRFTIRVKPGASRPSVGGSYGDQHALIVAVHSPPVDGGANAAVIEALARALEVPRRALSIAAGATARTKIIEVHVDDGADERVRARLASLLQSR
jgi:uncharacterized protein